MEPDLLIFSAFIIYIALIVGIGIYTVTFSSAGIDEFFIGGRRIHHVIVALSAVVSGRSAWLLLGFSGLVYVRGISAIWAVAGYIVVELFMFLYYAPRIRRYTGVYDCITIPDFLTTRFEDKKGVLRSISVLIILIFMMGYVSSQFVAGGKAFSSTFNMSHHSGIIITATIVLAYTMAGGFLAVSITDVVQSIFMILSLIVLPIVAILNFGGWGLFWDAITGISSAYPDPLSIGIGTAAGMAGIGLGSPGNPHIIARYMAIDDASRFSLAALWGTVWNTVMAFGALMIGLAGRVWFPDLELLSNSDPEVVFPELASQHLHPFLFGFVLASIFAAIMSTADSQLLVAASAVVRDIYEKLLNKNKAIEQKKLVFMSRAVVFILVVTSLIMGLLADDLVFWLVLFAWAGLGASLGPALLFSLFYRPTTKSGVITGMITGTLVTIIWNQIPVLKDNMYELIPGFICASAVTIIVSSFTKKPENTAAFFKAMKD